MSVAVDTLADLPLFASLTPNERDLVAGWAELRTASPGDRICGEGASGYSFSVLCSGAADVTQHGRPLNVLGPGDFFGELAILGDGRRSATVTAVERSTYSYSSGPSSAGSRRSCQTWLRASGRPWSNARRRVDCRTISLQSAEEDHAL